MNLFLHGILIVLFLCSVTALILSILNMVSTDSVKNGVVGFFGGVYTLGYIVAMIKIRQEMKNNNLH